MSTILIADDEPNIRELLRTIVTDLGHDVLIAEDGQEAFRIATTEHVDLMLLDIMMPGWNGVDALKSLDFINKRPSVLVVSGFISAELQNELEHLKQVSGYITKPFKLSDIRDRVTEVLSRQEG